MVVVSTFNPVMAAGIDIVIRTLEYDGDPICNLDVNYIGNLIRCCPNELADIVFVALNLQMLSSLLTTPKSNIAACIYPLAPDTE